MNFHALGVEISSDRSKTWIALAGRGKRGIVVELLEPTIGTSATERIAGLWSKYRLDVVLLDPRSASSTLVATLTNEALPLLEVSARDLAAAHGGFLDGLMDGTIKHRGHAALSAAMRAAEERPLAGSRAVDRRAGDPAPLVAAELATFGVPDDEEGLAPDQVTVSWI